MHLYNNGGIENVVKSLDGVFGFILVDFEKNKVFVGRDPYGIRPLFRLTSENGILGVCSEAKGLLSLTKILNGDKWKVDPFPPSTFEEYNLIENGKTKFVRSEKYYEIGNRPAFSTNIPYESNESIYLNFPLVI